MRVSMMENNFLDPEILTKDWTSNKRWYGIKRNYKAQDVVNIRNSVEIRHTLAENGANKLFKALSNKKEWTSALGALSGNQAVQMVKAGLKAIYLSGWPVAADSRLGETTYPDQS
jgi:isocitrate lyase